jgi:hypothetical protein
MRQGCNKEAVMARQRKYWVYVNEPGGDLVANIGECDDMSDALDLVVLALDTEKGKNEIHIVDNETSTTIWIAGPGNRIEQPEGWSVMDEEVARG